MTFRTLTACGIPPVLIFCVPLLAYAQLSQVGDTELGECASITEDSARLACYDEYAGGVRSPPASPEDNNDRLLHGNQRIREEIARLRQQNEGGQITGNSPENFGVNESNLVERDDGRKELIGRITDIKSGPSGWILTLEQGQIWRQMISKRFNLKKGQEVRIYPTRWGNAFRLSAENNSGFIQVERIQ